MILDDIRNIDFSNIDFTQVGDWPGVIKGFVAILIAIIALVGGYFYLVEPSLVELDKVEREEETLRDTFKAKFKLAVNLPAYREQLDQMEQTFNALRRQLPNENQVADLVVQFTRAGLAHGLASELFQPQKERPADFYVELPISIKVTGTFHDLAEFTSDIAGIPRIVTLHDISLKPAGKAEEKTASVGQTKLTMTGTAKTYRYVDEDAE